MARRWIALMLGAAAIVVIAVFLVACGGDGQGQAGPAGAAATTPQQETAPRTVTHALGTTDVPADATRIVVLNHYSLFDYLLALGIRPIASTGDPAASDPFAKHLAGQTDGVEMVGDAEGPNLERIAAVEPDLKLLCVKTPFVRRSRGAVTGQGLASPRQALAGPSAAAGAFTAP